MATDKARLGQPPAPAEQPGQDQPNKPGPTDLPENREDADIPAEQWVPHIKTDSADLPEIEDFSKHYPPDWKGDGWPDGKAPAPAAPAAEQPPPAQPEASPESA